VPAGGRLRQLPGLLRPAGRRTAGHRTAPAGLRDLRRWRARLFHARLFRRPGAEHLPALRARWKSRAPCFTSWPIRSSLCRAIRGSTNPSPRRWRTKACGAGWRGTRRRNSAPPSPCSARAGLLSWRCCATTASGSRRSTKAHAPISEQRVAKAGLLATLRRDYAGLKVAWGGYAGYDALFGDGLNNATFASLSLYSELVPAFEGLLARQNHDLPQFYRQVASLAALGDEARQDRLDELLAASGQARQEPSDVAVGVMEDSLRLADRACPGCSQ
jgi:hypothetical protein